MLFFISHQWQRCHNFAHFGQHIRILWKRIKKNICLQSIPIWICRIPFDMPWMPIPIRIRQKWCGSDLIRPHPDPQHCMCQHFIASLALCNTYDIINGMLVSSCKNKPLSPFSNFVVEKAYIEFWANSVSTGIWIWVCTFVLFFHDLYHPYGTK